MVQKTFPFGISTAPEHFQKRMSQVLTVVLIDDVLVYGKEQEEHDVRLEAVLQCLESAGVTLNYEKCEFSKSKIVFLGHVLRRQGDT